MNGKLYEQVNLNLKKVLGVRGKQLEISELTGLPSGSISRWFSGSREPGFSQLMLLFEAIGVKVIFPWEDESDFDGEVNERNRQIIKLNSSLEDVGKERLRLEGENRLLTKQLESLREENNKLKIEIYSIKTPQN